MLLERQLQGYLFSLWVSGWIHTLEKKRLGSRGKVNETTSPNLTAGSAPSSILEAGEAHLGQYGHSQM